ncbi:hypothetical protein F4824DRAFT_448983 [Ustulina deusta]|nr:hypothetical protein F4824DRAFT_448983 [Ustulina deusta]
MLVAPVIGFIIAVHTQCCPGVHLPYSSDGNNFSMKKHVVKGGRERPLASIIPLLGTRNNLSFVRRTSGLIFPCGCYIEEISSVLDILPG